MLDGGADDDLLIGFGGDDLLFGDTGNDTLLGGDGDDNLVGGADDDVISTGDKNDNSDEEVDAGTGNDTVYTRGEQLEGDDLTTTGTFEGDDLSGGADSDLLVVTNDNLTPNGSARGLNNVTGFEDISLNDGNHTSRMSSTTVRSSTTTAPS